MQFTRHQLDAIGHDKGNLHLVACAGSGKTKVPKFLKYDVLNDVRQILFIDRNRKKAGLTTSTDLDGTVVRDLAS